MEVTEALERVTQAIAALADLDVDGLCDAELHALVVALPGLADRVTAVAAPVSARWDARQVWATDGSKSAAARFARDTHRAQRTAAAELRRARALVSMPATSAAAVAGSLSLDQVDLLTSANTPARRGVFAEHEAGLIDTIRSLRYAHAARALRYWGQRADAELGRDDPIAEQQSEAARLHVSPTLDGMVAIDGLLDPVGSAIVVNELDRLIAQLRAADETNGVTRTITQLRAAALVEMASRSAATPADARRPKPLFTVLLGDRSLADLCELANGTVITPKHLAPYLSEAMLETVLFDGPTTVVAVSNKRSFTGALRRAIQVRDRHCQHPAGCDEPAERCDVDHIIPHAHGGPTSQFNGRLECPVHNRNPERHDHNATPHPHRQLDRLDELRARIRWRMHRDYPDEIRQPDDPWPSWPDEPDLANTG